jgi:hypothetical protein
MEFHRSYINKFLKAVNHPIIFKKSFNFKHTLQASRNILITCPADNDISIFGKNFKTISSIFPDKALTILYLSPDNNEHIQTHHLITSLQIPNPNLRNIFKSKLLKQLLQCPFDVFIDLDPNFCLLNSIICWILHPQIRIGFNKYMSKHLFNFLYINQPNTSYKENIIKLYKLIQSIQ